MSSSDPLTVSPGWTLSFLPLTSSCLPFVSTGLSQPVCPDSPAAPPLHVTPYTIKPSGPGGSGLQKSPEGSLGAVDQRGRVSVALETTSRPVFQLQTRNAEPPCQAHTVMPHATRKSKPWLMSAPHGVVSCPTLRPASTETRTPPMIQRPQAPSFMRSPLYGTSQGHWGARSLSTSRLRLLGRARRQPPASREERPQ